MQALCDFRITEFFQFFYAGDNLDHSSWEPRSLSGHARLDDKTNIMLLAFEPCIKMRCHQRAVEIPKTMAYIWMICMGLSMIGR